MNIEGKRLRPDNKPTQRHRSTDTWKVLKLHWVARYYQCLFFFNISSSKNFIFSQLPGLKKTKIAWNN